MVKRILHWLLGAVVIAYVVTGFGITEFRTVETVTFGLLTKPLAFEIHDNLFIPFLLLLVLHISISFIRKSKRKSPQ
ncbi:hypothetical protein ACFLVG_03175 [Chloroflexota bacterium]